MNKSLLTLVSILFVMMSMNSQTILNANGPGNTYEEINAVLAPNYNIVEVPDCTHTEFGRHIDEVYDEMLQTYVFRFITHKKIDNDRCKKFDRQRVEIKTYGKSPENTKATEGEIVEYEWLFKLPSDFKVSKSFTHLHQIKSVGGKHASTPMITFTARKGTPDALELRYTSTNDQHTIRKISLDVLKGNWLQVKEIIHFSNTGSYHLEIKKVSNDKLVFEYSNHNIDMWQDGAKFARPKWGIYRSLKRKEDLKDETILFNAFRIHEIPAITIQEIQANAKDVTLEVNTKKAIVNFKAEKPEDYDEIMVFNTAGKEMSHRTKMKKNKVDISELTEDNYYLVFLKYKRIAKVVKFTID